MVNQLRLTPLIGLSAIGMPYPLDVRSHARIKFSGALYCRSLRAFHRARPFRVGSPNGVIALRALLDIDSLIGHGRRPRGVAEEFRADATSVTVRPQKIDDCRFPRLTPGTLCRSDRCGPGLGQLRAHARNWRRSVRDGGSLMTAIGTVNPGDSIYCDFWVIS